MLEKLKALGKKIFGKQTLDPESPEQLQNQSVIASMDNNSTKTESIKEGVGSYLSIPHSGALMISGNWGCGKSYFIKNDLMKHIQTIPYKTKDTATASLTSEIVKLIQDSSVDQGKYYPVMISIFGKNSVSEIETSIKNEWLDKNTNGTVDKLEKISDSISKLWNKSEKLKSWFDLSESLSIAPKLKISNLPKNTVIILDDLERMSDEIKETDILGFINNLSENLGFKIIVVANEEYLEQQHSRHLDFKEKVVEKTLVFTPDIKAVSSAMISKFGDHEFEEFMKRDIIVASLDDSSPFAIRNQQYAIQLRNLRTVRFAISHFYPVYKEVVKYSNDERLRNISKDELLMFCWFTILALSIELKAAHISSTNIRGLDKFFYLNSMVFDLDDEPGLPSPAYTGESKDENSKENKILKDDDTYKRWFYQLYLKSRGQDIQPIPSPQLIRYVVFGENIDVDTLIDSYIEDKGALYPKRRKGDIMLEMFTHNLLGMSNEDGSSNIQKLYEAAKNGDFSELSQFINAGTYLQSFAELLPDDLKDNLIIALKDGVIKWFDENADELNDASKSRFQSIETMADKNIQWLYAFIKSKIQENEKKMRDDELKNLVKLFSEDTGKFCAQICPTVFSDGFSPFHVPYFMSIPILNEIPTDHIKAKVSSITVSDSNALAELAKNRYREDKDHLLYKEEHNFWRDIETALNEDKNTISLGRIMAENTLKPIVEQLNAK